MRTCEDCNQKIAKVSLDLGMINKCICFDCYNKMMAEELGVTIVDHPERVILRDTNGVERVFNIQKRIYPNGILLEAEENVSYGYKIAVDGELDVDQEELFHRLMDKVNRALATVYVKEGKFPNGHKYNVMTQDHLVGRIESGEDYEEVPIIVIDGKPYRWDQVGKMIMSTEGFQLRLEILEMTEDTE